MSNDLTVVESGALALTEEKLFAVLESSLYPGAKPESIAMVVNYCRAAKLDPIQKPVHIVPMWIKSGKGEGAMRDVIMPGVNLYRIQASRSGGFAGVTEPEFGPMVEETLGGVKIKYPEWCKVTVYRVVNGEKCAFTAHEFWIENYATAKRDADAPNSMWKKRPRGQLAKCTEAQALRKAFPEVAAAPTAEEMEGKYIDVTPTEAGHSLPETEKKPDEPIVLPAYPEDDFTVALPKWGALIKSGKKTAEAIITNVCKLYTMTDAQKEIVRALEPEKIADAPPETIAGEREPGQEG